MQYCTVKLGNDLNTKAVRARLIYLAHFWWISSTYNDRFIVLLAPQKKHVQRIHKYYI